MSATNWFKKCDFNSYQNFCFLIWILFALIYLLYINCKVICLSKLLKIFLSIVCCRLLQKITYDKFDLSLIENLKLVLYYLFSKIELCFFVLTLIIAFKKSFILVCHCMKNSLFYFNLFC